MKHVVGAAPIIPFVSGGHRVRPAALLFSDCHLLDFSGIW
jgi:hypothetical protein